MTPDGAFFLVQISDATAAPVPGPGRAPAPGDDTDDPDPDDVAGTLAAIRVDLASVAARVEDLLRSARGDRLRERARARGAPFAPGDTWPALDNVRAVFDQLAADGAM